MHDLSTVIFRGERDGTLKSTIGYESPYFFAERYDQAQLYAGRGTEPLCCVLQGQTVLDLTELNALNPEHIAVVKELEESFDDWTCRYSGEPRDVWSYLEGGDLYDYESNGDGERWRCLFDIALDKFDVVRVLDRTDGTQGQACPVWVTALGKHIREATLGERLGAMLTNKPWPKVQEWLTRHHADVLERIERLRMANDEYRLDLSPNLEHGEFEVAHLRVARTLRAGQEICPGDRVFINTPGQQPQDTSQDTTLKTLERVSLQDVYLSQTDDGEVFYLPAAWRIQADSPADYLRQLSAEQLRILCDGEQALITRHENEIEAVKARVLATFDAEACGTFHGPEHWARVGAHGHAVARSLGEDPLIAHVFAWVHDSQREDEGVDPLHGRRAQAFVQAHRGTLFSFLSDEQIDSLAYACELHSDGLTEGNTLVRACWDADRLDLWRVGVEPHPHYLCTPYARQPAVIRDAMRFSESEPDAQRASSSWVSSPEPCC